MTEHPLGVAANREWGAVLLRRRDSESVQLEPVARRIGPTLYRVGKKAAGRRLDGAMHEGRP